MPSEPPVTRKSETFPLLQLPAELRLRIYSYVCDHRFMSVPPQGRTTSIANFTTAFHLGRLCSQIRSEALPHVFAETVLTIEWDTLHRSVYANLPSLAAHAVTAVRIVGFPVHGDLEVRRAAAPGQLCPWSLTAFFPSLRQLRVVLRADECISRGMAARRSWYWGHDGFTAEDVMKVSGVHWIRRNKGLKKLTFKADDLCYDCARLNDAQRVLEEVGRLIKEDVEQLRGGPLPQDEVALT